MLNSLFRLISKFHISKPRPCLDILMVTRFLLRFLWTFAIRLHTRHWNTCSFEHQMFNWFMMTSSNGNIFRDTGHLCGEFTGHRWFPRTKASHAELWYFSRRLNKRLSKQSCGWWFETPSRPFWRHCNVKFKHTYAAYWIWKIPNVFQHIDSHCVTSPMPTCLHMCNVTSVLF